MPTKAVKLGTVIQTNIPMVLTLKNATGKKYESSFKPGTYQYLFFFIGADGTEYSHYASEQQNETLKLFANGEKVQVVREEKVTSDNKRYSIYVWTPTEGVEARAAATPQLQSNTAQTRTERKHDDYEKQDKIKQVMISLAGLTQAYIIAGSKDPLHEAVDMRNQIISKAISIVEAQ